MAAEGNAWQLLGVVTLLAAAVVAVPLLKRIGFGSVLGYLTAGMMIGPFGLQLIHDPNTIIQVGELGVVMFLFVIGLELKPSHLWELRGQIFWLQPAGGGLCFSAHLRRYGLWFPLAGVVCVRGRFCTHIHSLGYASPLGAW